MLVLLFACGGGAELAGLIDHAIGRGRRAVVLDSNAEWAGKQASKKNISARFSPPPAPTSLLLLWLHDPSLLLSLHPFFTSIVQ